MGFEWRLWMFGGWGRVSEGLGRGCYWIPSHMKELYHVEFDRIVPVR